MNADRSSDREVARSSINEDEDQTKRSSTYEGEVNGLLTSVVNEIIGVIVRNAGASVDRN